MSVKTILVHLDAAPRCTTRVALAAQLAHAFESHLIGLAPTGMADVVLSMNTAVPDGLEIMQLSARYLRGRAEATIATFRTQLKELAPISHEALVTEAEPGDAMIHQGRCSDLVILGQSDPGRFIEGVTWDFPQRVLMHVGRPALIVPFAGEFATIGRRVLLAWNGGREAAVAVRDALPFLQVAERVDLLAVGPLEDTAGNGRNGLDEAMRWLARHGVDAKCHAEATSAEAGEKILSRAADFGADLIVMGAYGHSRMRQWALGGATKTLLAHMTVPVLMAR